jgi:hypothetical protein
MKKGSEGEKSELSFLLVRLSACRIFPPLLVHRKRTLSRCTQLYRYQLGAKEGRKGSSLLGMAKWNGVKSSFPPSLSLSIFLFLTQDLSEKLRRQV